jgi:hypothetical protein
MMMVTTDMASLSSASRSYSMLAIPSQAIRGLWQEDVLVDEELKNKLPVNMFAIGLIMLLTTVLMVPVLLNGLMLLKSDI